jgi:hypothetical protein
MNRTNEGHKIPIKAFGKQVLQTGVHFLILDSILSSLMSTINFSTSTEHTNLNIAQHTIFSHSSIICTNLGMLITKIIAQMFKHAFLVTHMSLCMQGI